MEKKVSIIVPVYNVSLYLDRCLTSLINQTYRNIEILAIDDDSTDNSLEILYRYQELDKRIKVFHKKNGGAASARNLGLEKYRGDYVSFVDSDDYVDSNYIEQLVKILEQHDADISVCSFYNVNQDYITINDYHCEVCVYNEIDFLKKFLDDWTCGLIWNKLFKTHVIKGVRFKEGHKIDDEFFTYHLVMNSHKIVLFNKALYHYLWRDTSVMNNKNNQDIIIKDRLEYLEERYLNVKMRYPQLEKIYFENYIDNLLRLKSETTNVDTIRYIQSKMRKNIFFIMKSKISIFQKINILNNIFMI